MHQLHHHRIPASLLCGIQRSHGKTLTQKRIAVQPDQRLCDFITFTVTCHNCIFSILPLISIIFYYYISNLTGARKICYQGFVKICKMYVKFLTSELFNTLIVICPQIRYTKIKIRYGGFCVGGMHDMARTVAIGLQDFGDLIQKGYF